MRYWTDLPVIDCFNAHQDRTITQQLELGIRYFDFDVAYVAKEQVCYYIPNTAPPNTAAHFQVPNRVFKVILPPNNAVSEYCRKLID